MTDGQINVGTIGAIEVSESNANIVYVGTGSACPRGNVSLGDGVYKSTDAGKTWQHIGLEKAGLIGRIRIHPQNPDIAYVAVLGNIFGPIASAASIARRTAARRGSRSLHQRSMGVVDLALDVKGPNILFAALWTAQLRRGRSTRQRRGRHLPSHTDAATTGSSAAKPAGNARSVAHRLSVSRANRARLRASQAGDDKGGVFRATTAATRGRGRTKAAGRCSGARSITRTSCGPG
jgi:hypothetical protein